jgi:hypothetical protein
VTNSFAKIYDRADAEFEFDLTFRVLESTLWQDEHCFLPPFNLILVLLYPFKLILPRRNYRGLERFFFFALCWPMMLLVWFLEVLGRLVGLAWWSEEEDRRKKMEKEVVAVVDGERREITRLDPRLETVTARAKTPEERMEARKASVMAAEMNTSFSQRHHPNSPRRRSEPPEEQARMLALLEMLASRVEELGGKLDEANSRIEDLSRARQGGN